MFDFPFNILYNMLFAYTLFCMLYVYSSVMEDKLINVVSRVWLVKQQMKLSSSLIRLD